VKRTQQLQGLGIRTLPNLLHVEPFCTDVSYPCALWVGLQCRALLHTFPS
jgi:hypothetical protein